MYFQIEYVHQNRHYVLIFQRRRKKGYYDDYRLKLRYKQFSHNCIKLQINFFLFRIQFWFGLFCILRSWLKCVEFGSDFRLAKIFCSVWVYFKQNFRVCVGYNRTGVGLWSRCTFCSAKFSPPFLLFFFCSQRFYIFSIVFIYFNERY